MISKRDRIEQNALDVLQKNDRGTHTVPSANMYPHAWLWDSAFSSIGLRHINPRRAATEIDTILDSQWQNGMIANMRLSPGSSDRLVWAAHRHPSAPHHVHTSGISQPPVLAEAVMRVSEKLDCDDRHQFVVRSLGRIASFHKWIYRERNPNGSGLFAAVHPWETGMENTPPWMEHMRSVDWGLSGKILQHIGRAAHGLRRDTKHTPAHQRADRDETALFFLSAVKLRNARYDSKKLHDNYPLHVEDIALNSIFVRNNQVLENLSDEYGLPLGDELRLNMQKSRQSLESLWDSHDHLYYSRDAVSGKLINIPTIASLMPLYAGTSSPDRRETLVNHIKNAETFGAPFGVPTVPVNSEFYRSGNYWTGPMWVNTNWLLIDGLYRAGHEQLAKKTKQKTLHAVSVGGMHEYFDAKTAQGLGAKDFSWTAALTLDLLHQDNNQSTE